MAQAFDASTTGTASGGYPVTKAHTCTGTNLYLVVTVTTIDAAAKSSFVNGITYNGVAMTLLDSTTDDGVWQFVVYGLAAPASGAHNVVINGTGTDNANQYGIASYTGVHQTTPIGTVDKLTGSGTSLSNAVTTVAGDLVADAVGVRADVTNLAPGGSQTQRWIITTANDTAGSDQAATGTSVTMAWSWTTTRDYCNIAVPLKTALNVVACGGSQTCTGTLTRLVLKPGMAGSQTNTGTVLRTLIFARTNVGGAISFVGTVVRRTTKSFAGVFTPTGNVDWLRPLKLIARLRDYFLRAEQVDHDLTADNRDYFLTAPKRDDHVE